ncbi:hypothetical protein EDB92DRAFT_380091 [Lactarius akahatsu]|uniref:Uncharacterized protein n=1 Tax=Lactarius akahatsu TaxID=416441 RepID=A0AAD4LK78_9AGAM|nr:hypothetical protein EDB92DRAFT_380091 [Lactarius akahatsu]
MATDHNILSPASVRVFTVLLCVCLCTANLYSLFLSFFQPPTHNHDRHCRAEAAHLSAAFALSKHFDKSLVTVFNEELVANGTAISIAIDSARCDALRIINEDCSSATSGTHLRQWTCSARLTSAPPLYFFSF